MRLRNEIRTSRGSSPSELEFTELLAAPEFQQAKVIATYYSFGDEPNTEKLNREILKMEKLLLLPALRPDRSLEFRLWDGEVSNLARNGNLSEPIGPKFANSIDLMIVPALAVDKDGNRLGRGGGSYDRALREYKVFSIALINEGELLEVLPAELHDEKVSAVLAGKRLIRF